MLNFQDMIMKLSHFWAEHGCLIHQGYDLEVGAGTFNPATFLRCLGPEPYRAVYVEPSRRPKDGRYGENPNRVQFYHQMQVILKPSPFDLQNLYLSSLEAIGLELNKHDIRFVHDDWENPTIGAWGLGWEVWIDGMEITQFTYFQAVGGLVVKPVSGELTYGLERLAMYIQGVDSIFDLVWKGNVTYGDIFKRSEWEWSHYNFKDANAQMWFKHFEDFEKEAHQLIEKELPIPAYDFVMKVSHAFNILDARGVISVTERTHYISRIRNLAHELAHAYIKSREKQKFPLLQKDVVHSHPKAETVSGKCSPEEKQDLLLEIGSEELPASFVPIGMQNLENLLKNSLENKGLSFKKISVYGTPRRLAALVEGLSGGLAAKKVEKKGPPVEVAFDSEGHPTQSGAGFFRSLNLEPMRRDAIERGLIEQIEIRIIRNTAYLFAKIEVSEVSTRAFLAQELPNLILKIDFPKKMRWGSLDIEYARPLRWICALYGEEVIPFVVGNILSGRETFGHRQLSLGPVFLSHANTYLTELNKHSVLADVKERKESILQQLKNIERNLKGKAVAKEKVLAQVLHLVEWPFVTVGIFEKRFLKAPREVLISEMVEHQKYFPVENEDGTLQNAFLITCNIFPTDLIRAGNQKALSPRLADGMFLYEEDLKKPLESFNEKLKTMTFQKKWGSMWEKVKRLERIVSLLHEHLPLTSLEKAKRAAFLSKSDLATELVGEFPELQGHVGMLYALNHGEDQEVALSIEEQWMPKGENAPLPKTGPGILLSLADKIDNFLSCFLLDLKPTSSSDPFALRRQGFGLIKILIESKARLNLDQVFSLSFDLFLQNEGLTPKDKEELREKKDSTLKEIQEFLTSRSRTIYGEKGFEKDEIEACLSHGLPCCYDMYLKIAALHTFRKENHDLFLFDLEIHMRVKKILQSQRNSFSPLKIDPLLFKDESESNLFEKIEETRRKFDRFLEGEKNYHEAFETLSDLKVPLNLLFERVKIIDDDQSIRQNRLSLLHGIWGLCEELIDFGKIQEHSMSM